MILATYRRSAKCAKCNRRTGTNRYQFLNARNEVMRRMLCANCAASMNAWQYPLQKWTSKELEAEGLLEQPRLYAGKTVDESIILEIVRQNASMPAPETRQFDEEKYSIEIYYHPGFVQKNFRHFVTEQWDEKERIIRESMGVTQAHMIIVSIEGKRDIYHRINGKWEEEKALGV